jgi:hypothetical protein
MGSLLATRVVEEEVAVDAVEEEEDGVEVDEEVGVRLNRVSRGNRTAL